MSLVKQEHYEVARRFRSGREFSRSEFVNLYHQLYPNRAFGSIMPADFCVNIHNKGNVKHPRFLYWCDRGMYRFDPGSSGTT